MMDAISLPRTREVVFKTSSQVGKTDMLNNIIGYHVHYDPAPIMMVQPNEQDAQAWSKGKLDPMIRDTPVIAERVAPERVKDKRNTILHKTFPGGFLKAVGAFSPRGLRRESIRIMLLDEIDAYPPEAGHEGDPVELALKRVETFYSARVVMASTPTDEEVSRIERSFQLSSQSYYYVPCPKCGHRQILVFGPMSALSTLAKGMLKFDTENLSWVYYECENCKHQIPEVDKGRMLLGGEWRAQFPDRVERPGFFVNTLYSPWARWKDIAAKFLEAKKMNESLKSFVNTTLGEVWRSKESYTVNTHELANRVENYEAIPDGVLLMTAGVDVQDNRLEVFLKGWGVAEESWFIDRRIIYGSPAYKTTWDQLDEYLATPWVHESGMKLKPGMLGGLMAVGVDSGGHFTREAYDYVNRRKGNRFFALKGRAGHGVRFLARESFSKKYQTRILLVGVDTVKETIYDRLKIEKPGPGYMHFNPKCDAIYFDQLTAERRVTKRIKTQLALVWELIAGRTNEALDGEVYAFTVMRMLKPNFSVLAEKMKRRIEQFKDLAQRVETAESQQTQSIVGRPKKKRLKLRVRV